MRSRRVLSWCAAFCAAARGPSCEAQGPPTNPPAWINEVDLKAEPTEYVYVEIVIRQHEHNPEVDIGSLRLQFFSAGGSTARFRKLSATAEPLPDVTVRSDSSCSRDAHPTRWCAGTDSDLFTIRRTYVQRQAGQLNTQLPNVATEWGLALCSGDTLLDFVGYMSFDYSRTASAPPGAPGTAACGVGYHATMIGSGGTQLVYPANTPAASVGRYGTGNQIVDYQWGAFDVLTEDVLNEGRCRSVLGDGMGPPNPACQQNFGNAEDAPVPPSAPAPPTDSASTSPSPPTGATACVGHYDDCPENCVDVTYHYDVQAPPGDWPPQLACHDEDGHTLHQGTAKKCHYGDGDCRPPDCVLQMAPHGGRTGTCADPFPDGSQCSVGCDDEFYRVTSNEVRCDCSALTAYSRNAGECGMAWTNTQATSNCQATDQCLIAWPQGWYGDNQILETGEGFCAQMSQCHSDTQYIAQEPTWNSQLSAYTSDRVCADISPCDIYTTYQSLAPLFGTPGVAGTSGSIGRDRQCLPLQVCGAFEYESGAPARPTPDIDPSAPNIGNRQCSPIRTCRGISNGVRVEYEVSAPMQDPRAPDPRTAMYITNRQCQLCSQCGLTEYIRTPCSEKEDTDCALLTVCPDGDQEAEPPTPNADRTTYIANRRCATEVPRCPDDNYESQQEIRTGYTDEQQQWVAAQPRICEPLRDCGETQYEPTDTRGSRTCALMQLRTDSLYCADRQCLPLTVCPHGQYEIVPPPLCTPGDHTSGYCGDRVCQSWSPSCGDGNYQARDPSATNDRVCLPLSACGDGQWAPPLVTGYNENLGDRECTDWRQCGPGQYQTVAPSLTVDRQCGDWRVCNEQEYESHAPGPMQPGGWSIQNRHCQSVSGACQPYGDVPGALFQFAPPNATSDRICRPARAECAENEWQTSTPTWNRDRGCLPLRVCASNERQTVAPTATTDRQCEKIEDNSGADDGGGGALGALLLVLGGGGAGGGAFWHTQQKKKREGLLADKNAPEEIELDDFK